MTRSSFTGSASYRGAHARRQRGATLFISLMILILLTLLALSAAQVTGLQERMAGLYNADNAAFQAAEDALRDSERGLLFDPLACEIPAGTALPTTWVDGSATTGGARLENMTKDNEVPGLQVTGSAKVGQNRVPGGANCLLFRASAYGLDRATDPTSRALVQSLYVPFP